MLDVNKIYNTNCLEGMKVIPDDSIDMVFTDPPYNISTTNEHRDKNKPNSPIMRQNKALNYDFGDWDNMERKEFLDFTKDWLIEACRVLKQDGAILSFFNKEDISYLGWEAKSLGVRTRTIFTWHKTNPVPSFRKVNYLSSCEYIWIGSKGDFKTFNFKQQKNMHNFFETPNKSSYGVTDHPTEKPLALIKHLVEIHTQEGDTVLDPFMGSGTTAIACIDTGRKYIGFELDENHYNTSLQRINDHTRQVAFTDLVK